MYLVLQCWGLSAGGALLAESCWARWAHPGLVQQMPQKLRCRCRVGPAEGKVPCACAGADWREVSTLDLVPGDAPGLLLLVGGGPAARAWARAAALALDGPGSCSPGGAAGLDPGRVLNEASMEPGRLIDGESVESLPSSAGMEAMEPMAQTLERSEGRAGGQLDAQAQAQTGSEARQCGQRPPCIRVVHVCRSAEAATALLAAEGAAAWESQAGAARPRVAVDPSSRWATLREVGLCKNASLSFRSGYCGVQRMRRS